MWTRQDLDLVETLTRRVHMLSAEQIARIPWAESGNPAPRLRKLSQSGLVACTVLNVRRLASTQPVLRWNPGDDEPDCERLAEVVTNRWPRAAEPIEVYWATKLAANLFGSSSGRLPDLNHRDHDLLLADAYVHYRLHEPVAAARWLGEDARPKAGYRIKDPDAFIIGDDGEVVRVIESSGRYAVQQLLDFHVHCESEGLSYELW